MGLLSLKNIGFSCMAGGAAIMGASAVPHQLDPLGGTMPAGGLFVGGVGLMAVGGALSVADLGFNK